MKSRTKKILLLTIPFVVFAVYYGYRRVSWELAGNKSWAVQRKLESGWAGNSFQVTAKTPAQTVRESVRAQMQKLETAQPPMEPFQRNALADAVAGMFLAYSAGSPSQFVDFRFPSVDSTKVKWDPTFLDFANESLRMKKIDVSRIGNEYRDNVELYRKFFELSSSLTNKLGQPMWCGSCWTGLALDSLRIASADPKTGFAKLQDFAESEGSINYSLAVGATYSPVPIERKWLRFVAVTVRTGVNTEAVRTDDRVRAYRIYGEFYWDSGSQRWFPQRLILPIVPNEAATILF